MHLTGTEVEKIGIFRALQLGDLLCSIPAIRAIKEHFPHSSVALIGLPWSAFMVERFPGYFNDHFSFPGYPGLPEQDPDLLALPDFLRKMQQQNFSLMIQMHGAGNVVNPLVASFQAGITAGYYKPGNFRPSEFFFPYPENMHEIHRHMKLVSAMRIDAGSDELEFPLLHQDRQELRRRELELEPGSFVCIHPGARDPCRRWDAEYFSRLGNYCYESGYTVVITGSGEEADLAGQVASRMDHPSVNAAGRTSLGGLAALISNAKALISNCTGVAHLASALKKRSIVISLNDEPERWSPLNKKLHTTIVWNEHRDFQDVWNALEKILCGSSVP